MNYYKVHMSTKVEAVIDQQDYEKLVAGMNSGSFVKLKKAIINPSFIIAITPIEATEALRDEPKPKLEGYVDEKRNVFVPTNREVAVQGLTDSFK